MKAVMLAVGFVIALGADAGAQPSRCADCHYADRTAPNAWHRDQWDVSPHGRAGIGCERCHGGNPETFDQLFAHRGILAGGVATSPVHPANLPATCGSCHLGAYIAFQSSWHFQMLRSGDLRAPTCATCHGDVEGVLLSPKNLESQCADCHGPRGVAPRLERPAEARVLLQTIHDTRARLAGVRKAIRRTGEPQRRAALDERARRADVALLEATQAIHQFSFDAAEDRLDVARQRLAALSDDLASLPASPQGSP